MAYAKFDCQCGCGGKVQLEGSYLRGHKVAVKEELGDPERIMNDLAKGLAKARSQNEANPPTASEAPSVPMDKPPLSSEPPNLCACGCGKRTWRTWHRGHAPRQKLSDKAVDIISEPVLPPPAPTQSVTSAMPEGPPAYPAPIDRRRWRIASERPNTPLTNPWIETKCHSCLNPMWTRDPLSTWEHGGICEEDDYILRSELGTHGRRQFQLQAHTYHDPFRPR